MSDTTLRAALALHRAAQTWTTHLLTRTTNAARRDRGAGFVEYAGLMILIAGIFTLIDGLALDSKISSAIGTAVSNVISGG
ncbi:hypothetical protein G6W47_15170 [Streptomyces sp. CAI-21]|uniref:Uncharacterized protein n=1 Tax=Streptomyces albidoflavus TaxID=1886 RepID=A0AA37C0M1_9ACTN|nr:MULTISPECIES: hypothetical protein [Streptomyces]NUW08252.1 hypothetical protein [Streptomyces sp. CAI-21]NVI27775.1 hypothetical protein [Streptomyces sp. CAI-17]AMM10791.1 hypothetical protein Salbus254_4329 [Streptomyces albidoflavus]NEC99816.1 hypothetical protein [Streptomyces albidoflavus]PJT48042.1 hypothetical protein CWI85_24820 [Streptomyces albidoflavus]